MDRNGKYAQRKKTEGKGRWLLLPLLLLLILLVGGGCLLAGGSDSREEPAVSTDQDTVHSAASGNTAHTEPAAGTAEDPMATQLQETETAAPAETEGTESQKTAEAAWQEGPAAAAAFEEKTAYETVLDQYRQAITMETKEYMELHSNEDNCSLSIDILRENYYPGKGSGIYESEEKRVELAEDVLKRAQLPTLTSRYPYINQNVLTSIHMYREDGELYGENHDLYYAYYDLDANGTLELLIGDCNEYSENIIGLYTIRYEKPYILENTTGNRSYLTIYTDGTVCIDSSGGASIHSWSFYCMNKEWDILDLV